MSNRLRPPNRHVIVPLPTASAHDRRIVRELQQRVDAFLESAHADGLDPTMCSLGVHLLGNLLAGESPAAGFIDAFARVDRRAARLVLDMGTHLDDPMARLLPTLLARFLSFLAERDEMDAAKAAAIASELESSARPPRLPRWMRRRMRRSQR